MEKPTHRRQEFRVRREIPVCFLCKVSELLEVKIKAICAELPDRMYGEVKSLVESGWFRNEDDLILEALRRFLDTHKVELMEQYIREDVEWGLHGKD